MNVTLRQYQQDAITLAKNSLSTGNKRVVIALATGGGKSAICESIILGARAKGKRVMFLVNRVQLADQMSAHLSRARIQHGVMQGENTRGTYHDVIIASIDTIHRRGYPDCDLILADECHGAAGSKKYHKLFEHYKNATIIGVTATPMAKGLGKAYPWGNLFQDIVSPISIPELIEQGYLVDVDIYTPSEPDLSNVKIVAGDYHEGQLGEAVDKPTLIGDIVTQWHKLAKGKQTIAFGVNIPHSQHIVESFIASGVSAVHVDYSMPYEEKAAIIKRFRDGEFMVLSNCALLSEGFDAPATECMILARPTKSLARYIQMAGRILRPSPGKEKAIMLDHSGSAVRLGFPTDAIEYTLCDGKPKTSTGSAKKAEEKKPTKCPSCSYLKKAGGKCPVCGFLPKRENTIEHAEGELGKLERKGAKMKTVDKRKLYAELKTIAHDRKWSDGRLANVFRDIAGTWPPIFARLEPRQQPSEATLKAVQYLNIKFAKSKARHAQ